MAVLAFRELGMNSTSRAVGQGFLALSANLESRGGDLVTRYGKLKVRRIVAQFARMALVLRYYKLSKEPPHLF